MQARRTFGAHSSSTSADQYVQNLAAFLDREDGMDEVLKQRILDARCATLGQMRTKVRGVMAAL